jgi:hypothetical protein
MVWWWAAAAFAGRWDNVPTDVTVEKVVPKPVAEIQATVGDWRGWERILPCASEWVHQARSTGVDARSEAVYRIGPLRRRLVGVVRKDTPGLVTELETEGKKGWFTQVTYAPGPTDGTTRVTLHTPLTAPKAPLTGVFHKKVKPAWEACYTEALGRL